MVTKLPLHSMSESIQKISNVIDIIRQHAHAGEYIILPHAISRQEERNITVPDIVFVLKYGEHETGKDVFKPSFRSWNYAIRGKTIDGRSIRIAIAFDKNDMLIVTVIPLGKRRK